MKGSHRVIVESKKVKYDFVIRRNITILTGDSATGKTTLIDYIREFRRYGQDSGVLVTSDCPCRTLDDEDWERQLDGIAQSIIFIDEGNRYLTSKRFAEKLHGNDNYFVIATQERLPMLPYSIEEMYGFRISGKFHQQRKTYNELYHLYGVFSAEEKITPKLVITEDSNAGHEFFSCLSDLSGIPCISAGGKSSLVATFASMDAPSDTLFIVDGAAFGSEMKEVSELLKEGSGVVLYAPESFEWLLLSSGILPEKEITEILEHPENFADSKDYISWERFFTSLLTERTKDNPVWRYTKSRLNKSYTSPKIVSFVKNLMSPVEWESK